MTTLITYEQPSYRYAKRVKRVKPKRHKPRWPKETLFDKICERPLLLVYLGAAVWAGVTLSKVPEQLMSLYAYALAGMEICSDDPITELRFDCGDCTDPSLIPIFIQDEQVRARNSQRGSVCPQNR